MRILFSIFAGLIAINVAMMLPNLGGIRRNQTQPADGNNGYYKVTHRCAPDFERRGLSQGSRFYVEQIFLMYLETSRELLKQKDLTEDAIDKKVASVSEDRLLKYVKLIPDSERSLVVETLQEVKTRKDIEACLLKYAG